MSERCIVRIKFTPVDAGMRSAVGAFLRYIQHRDLHPTAEPAHVKTRVSSLVKYAAYRDGASARAELFSSDGKSGTQGRKDFVDFVARSISGSQPQLFRNRASVLMDRRRAVSRLVISPERAGGLDLEQLTRAATDRLAADAGGEIRWIAAIHRNTAHHHVHLVVAGMRRDAEGRFHRLDITKPRLEAIKQAVGLEIERQRRERVIERPLQSTPDTSAATPVALQLRVERPLVLKPSSDAPRRARVRVAPTLRATRHGPAAVLRLRAVARMYQRQVEREAEQEATRYNWELAA